MSVVAETKCLELRCLLQGRPPRAVQQSAQTSRTSFGQFVSGNTDILSRASGSFQPIALKRRLFSNWHGHCVPYVSRRIGPESLFEGSFATFQDEGPADARIRSLHK
jgi:hypothetical protein